ncbi:MAG: tetratricopeptide repeat protein [Crocinitomicaceae bacterium]|nr:tetratricopeptide repeat protein [Crocinitomicaceae bacterium]
MKKFLLIVAIGFATVTFSQKGNTSSAGIAYKNYKSNLMQGDYETAVAELKDAKEFIDKSYVHEDTKDDPKTLMYYGMIYINIPMAAQLAGDEELKNVDVEKAFTEALAALKRSKEVDEKGRYHEDIDQFCNQLRVQSAQLGVKMYEEEKWGEAASALLTAATFADVMGITDSLNYYYGGLAAFQVDTLMEDAAEAFGKTVEMGYLPSSSTYYYSQSLQNLGKNEEAEAMIKKQIQRYPNNKDILVELINFYIGTDRKEEAIKALNDAIELDPENVQLIYTAGTIYENMDDFENAEKSYLKALEINPKDGNVLSALGGLYFNKGADLNNEANTLEFGDPNYDSMVAESKEFFKKSVPYLEQAVDASPEECTYKVALRDAYGKVGDVEKFKDMKQKASDCDAGQ